MVLVLAALLALPATMSVSPSADAAVQTTVLRIGFAQRVDSLNPYMGTSDAASVLFSLVYDTLEVADAKLNPSPDLAVQTWAVPSDDSEMIAHPEYPFGSVWQYNLTHEGRFTDGEAFTADDVVFNINLNARNYSALWAFQPYSYFIKDAVKVDDYTVRIHYADRASGKATACAFADLIAIPMLPKHMFFNMTAFDIAFKWDGVFPTETVPIVGTGPFMATSSILDDWLHSDTITLRRNPDCHWKTQYNRVIHFDKIEMVFFEDVSDVSMALRQGTVTLGALSPSEFVGLRDGNVGNVSTYAGPGSARLLDWLEINMNSTGTHQSRLDPAVRRAMQLALDKDYMCRQFYGGMATPGSTLVPPGGHNWHYNLTRSERLDYNLTLANMTLEDAGYKFVSSAVYREATPESLSVQSNWSTNGTLLTYDLWVERHMPTEQRAMGDYIVQQWAKIGIDLNIHWWDNTIFPYGYPEFPPPDISLTGWYAGPDPNTDLFSQATVNYVWNENFYKSEAYSRNYSMSVQSIDRSAREVYVSNCQRIDYEDVSRIVLAYPDRIYAWRTDVFDGWGNWSSEPGRCPDNFWGGNSLFFDLEPRNVPTSGNSETLLLVGAAAVAVSGCSAAFLLVRRWRKGPG